MITNRRHRPPSLRSTKRIFSGILGLISVATGNVPAQTPAPEAPDARPDFVVTLPPNRRPFPEPLPAGAEPGFKLRGTKGWGWTREQYLAEIPYLVRFKMNFLMNCYTSLWDLEHHPLTWDLTRRPNWQDGEANRWWEDLPPAKKQALEEIVRECQRNGIQFCFSMNPNYTSRRPVTLDSVDLLWKHYAWMQGLGVRWFNISVDDATAGIDASGQAKVVNEIFRRLRAKDPAAQLIFCPTYYWGDGTGKEQRPYLEVLAREMDKDIYLFWTGDVVVGKITRQAADTFRSICGHRVFLWDNYPVNDNSPTMHLGPVIDRDPTLCGVIDGYMSNPHCRQNEINRIPLATCADYAYNPAAYDPARSIGQAIMHLTATRQQGEVLAELVEAYPGMLRYEGHAGSTTFNPVREQYRRIAGVPHSVIAARAYLDFIRRLSIRLKSVFPDNYAAEKKTLDDDITLLEQKFAAQYQ